MEHMERIERTGQMERIEVGERYASNYDSYYREGPSEWRRLGALAKAENILELCGDLPHDSILEIGAGDGAILKRLDELRFGEQLHALEISPSGVKAIEQAGLSRLVECRTYGGYTIPYGDSRFDLVILSHVIEHVEHPRQLLYDAARAPVRCTATHDVPRSAGLREGPAHDDAKRLNAAPTVRTGEITMHVDPPFVRPPLIMASALAISIAVGASAGTKLLAEDDGATGQVPQVSTCWPLIMSGSVPAPFNDGGAVTLGPISSSAVAYWQRALPPISTAMAS